ncbi:MAG: biotin--[acetyl-CoA-carboxylase] ligase [Lachnospiraceae bacterium]
MKEKILKILKDADGFVSGQHLCEQLDVSRTAIWKAINQLKKDGYEIDAVTNKGYCLKNCPDLVDEQTVAPKLDTKSWGRNLLFFEEVDSTNNVIKKEAENGAPAGTLAIAEIQTAGRGRRGRSWSSPKSSGIWMSYLLRPEIAPGNASMLTLVAAMAARKAIYQETGLETLIKWPNDIVVHGRKVCGMLTEMNAEVDWVHYVVIGIGFNVNTKEFPEEIRPVATSLQIEMGHTVNRSNIIAKFGKAFEEYYDLFLQTEDLCQIMEEYNKNLANNGKEVRIIETNNEYTGVAKGINEMGELIVMGDDGQEHIVRSGEVSVRGIYGYV